MTSNSLFQDRFFSAVFTVVNQIPAGCVSTYGDVAKMARFPGYARHVGKALASIPAGSALPWYRVINSQGKISLTGTNYEWQLQLLAAENIVVSPEGRISLRNYRWQP